MHIARFFVAKTKSSVYKMSRLSGEHGELKITEIAHIHSHTHAYARRSDDREQI